MYYEPHASRNNLFVLTSAHVTRISLPKFSTGEVTAESVCFIYNGNEHRAFIQNEVIVSAGYASRNHVTSAKYSFIRMSGYFRAVMSPQVTLRVSPILHRAS